VSPLPLKYFETSLKIAANSMPEIGKKKNFFTRAHAPEHSKIFTRQNNMLQNRHAARLQKRCAAPFQHFTQKNAVLHHKLSVFVNCVDNLCQLSNTAGDKE
jgi:hypothetical protein